MTHPSSLISHVVAMCTMAATAAAAVAGSATASMTIGTTVLDQCVVAGGSGSGLPSAVLDFGNRDALDSNAASGQTPSSGSGALQIQCSSNVTATLTVDAGANTGGSSVRRLRGPSGVLVDYALYRDSGYTQAVGTAAYSLPAITGGATPYVVMLYGRLPTPGQATAQGSYSDSVSITVAY